MAKGQKPSETPGANRVPPLKNTAKASKMINGMLKKNIKTIVKNMGPRNSGRLYLHTKCRSTSEADLKYYEFVKGKPKAGMFSRFVVLDAEVPWSVQVPTYQPQEFTSEKILASKNYDPKEASAVDFGSRKSTMRYEIDTATGRPLNPQGRTGITGRGHLGNWGPNKAGDAVVIRLMKSSKHNKADNNNELPNTTTLELLVIRRKDTGEFALPGGMQEEFEGIATTVRREFTEETLARALSESETVLLDEFFKTGVQVYAGYVDDPRNTDNAWMETTAFAFYDTTGILEKFEFKAGDDAIGVQWVPITPDLKLYASHLDLVKLAVEKMW